ncbi:MAG: hypothetical protein HC898_11895 [Phycisphaerales bacterium]|nr:hypothetical protein [Phycisphaerales bacterium]
MTLDGGTLNSGVVLETSNLNFIAGQIGTGQWNQDITLRSGDTIGGGQFSGAILVDGGALYDGEFSGSMTYLRGTIGTGTWEHPIT